jgi:molecular chaperone GrpE (heat shock protein)
MNEEKVTTIDGAVDNSTEHAVEHHDMKTEGHMVNNFDHQFDQETVLSLLLANQAAIKSLINKLDSIVERMQELSCRVYNIGDELSGITSYINENSNRVRRLEEGYDFHILKNFSKQIIRSIYSLEKNLEKADDAAKSHIQDTIDSLIELLDRNSIVQVSPEVGSLYSGQEKIAECIPLKCYTDDESLDGRIASVVYAGYLYEFNENNSRVIMPAKVVLFSTDKKQCSEIVAFTSSLSDTVRKKLKRLTTRSKDKEYSNNNWLTQIASLKTNFAFYIVIALCLVILVIGAIILRQNHLLLNNSNSLEYELNVPQAVKK